jgi:hypothetical protein
MKSMPEQPIDTAAPGSLRASGVRIRPLAVVFVGVLLLVFCSLLWLSVASRSKVDSRNTPDALLAANSLERLAILSELPELRTNLTAADLAFGEEQMARMVKDRPEFARYVSKEDTLWQFCVCAFAGEAIGEHILWDNTLPEAETYRSESLGPYKGHLGFIRIRNNYDSGEERGRSLSCEELWSCAVFEIENIRNHKAFMALYDRALDGKLSREEWIRGCSRLEYNALQRTSKDFAKLWRLLAKTRRVTITGSFWGLDIPATYEEWVSLYRDPNSYPWDVYGAYYDSKVVPYVKSRKAWQGVSR